jgi:Protein of unknown function (DUF3592)
MIRISGILVIVVGALMLYLELAPERMVRRSQTWLSTHGVVTIFRAGCISGGRAASCSVRLRYRYQVAGQELENGRITFNDDNLDTSDEVREYRARYAVGQTVPVFYDPGEPTSAVLERTAFWSLRYLFVGAAAVLVGAFMLLPRSWIYRLGGAPRAVAEG